MQITEISPIHNKKSLLLCVLETMFAVVRERSLLLNTGPKFADQLQLFQKETRGLIEKHK